MMLLLQMQIAQRANAADEYQPIIASFGLPSSRRAFALWPSHQMVYFQRSLAPSRALKLAKPATAFWTNFSGNLAVSKT